MSWFLAGYVGVQSEEQAVDLGLFMMADSAEGVTSVTPTKEGGRVGGVASAVQALISMTLHCDMYNITSLNL